jgi:hypothetical protein
MDTLFLTSCFFCVLTDEKKPTLGRGPPNEQVWFQYWPSGFREDGNVKCYRWHTLNVITTDEIMTIIGYQGGPVLLYWKHATSGLG